MDHFARPADPLVSARDAGTLHRNFQGYTTYGETDLLGFGVGAISHVGNTFTQNVRELDAYSDAIGSGHLPAFRGYTMTQEDAIRGAVIEDCLCNARVSKDGIEARFSINFDEHFAPELAALAQLESDGLIEGRASRTINVTATGRIFVRSIARVFDAFETTAVASKAV
jgi:oxygen-independent coproporphyrinogen-3 oxidase